jgi:hypothetical protein
VASRLDGARGKVQRSKELFAELIAKHRDFMGLNPFGVVVDQNPDTGERIWRARVSRQVPETWGILVGDIVHSLRAALDYLAWELWIANGGSANSSRANTITFPVVDPTKTYSTKDQKLMEKDRRAAFGATTSMLIERLQTETGRRLTADPSLRPLFLLHRLDIWDKHRRLNVVGGTTRLTQMRIGGPGEDVQIEHMVIGGGGPAGDVRTVPIADGTELMRLTLGAAAANVQQEQQFAHYIAFESDGPGKGEPLVEMLDQLISFVDEVLTRFSPLLPS